MLSGTRDSKRGQAIVEILPSVMLFMLVISAGLAYFRVMRAATIRQEAVRNLAFAKIDNSGTLTTVVTPDEGGVAAPITITVDRKVIPALVDGNNPFISSSTDCFTVIPGGEAQQSIPVTYRYGVSGDAPVLLRTYAVVCRR